MQNVVICLMAALIDLFLSVATHPLITCLGQDHKITQNASENLSEGSIDSKQQQVREM